MTTWSDPFRALLGCRPRVDAVSADAGADDFDLRSYLRTGEANSPCGGVFGVGQDDCSVVEHGSTARPHRFL